MPFFETVEQLPEDPILGIPALFEVDRHPKKVNLGIGSYRDSEGRPYILTTVREAEKYLLQHESTKDYLPIAGDSQFIQESLKLIFGADNPILSTGQIFAAQAIGGTGALRLGGEFLANQISKVIFVSDPTWPNHRPIFSRAGMRVEAYKYYDNKNHRIDFAGLCASVMMMPPASVILLQASCHNPTGMDLSFAQWQKLADLIKERNIFPFFDLAYQGFGKGIDEDAKAIRYFVEQGHELMVANSFSKNFGLYGERAGLLAVVVNSKENAKKVESQVKQIIRGIYSNPPRYGAQIVATILKTPSLKTAWQHELAAMRDRVIEMRDAFVFGLQSKAEQDFGFFNEQQGIFSFTGLTPAQVQRLREEKGVYLINNGRINVAGLTTKNMDYVIDSVIEILKT